MNEQTTNLQSNVSAVAIGQGTRSNRMTGFLICLGLLALVYSKTLIALAQLSWRSDLQSHVLLIPFVTLYLIWLRRAELPSPEASGGSLAFVPVSLGLLLAAGTILAKRAGHLQATEDFLSLMVISFVLMVVGNGLFFFGRRLMGSIAFPMVMLVFLAPMPKTVEMALDSFFQHASAEAASLLFSLAGAPLVRDDEVFRLPGLTIRVAPECSGIRSSFVLFITSLLAGNLFLRTPWKRVALALFVIPLGIIRNGFRIFTLGMLCIHVDKRMIDSWVHHRGGPMFFALSLVPFFLVLIWLRRSEPEDGPEPLAQKPV